jgi:two-component system sensor histidine kinase YesM
VPLEEELRLLDDYFLIQQYRYGGSVTLEKKIEDENLLKCEIPRFALQPLVENAIFHGIEPKGIGHIVLEVYKEANDVLISISDDGVGMSMDTIAEVFSDNPEISGSGLRQLGMRSVHERIRYAFGDGYGLSIKSEPGKYTTMIIRLPAGNYQSWKEEPGNDQTLDC